MKKEKKCFQRTDPYAVSAERFNTGTAESDAVSPGDALYRTGPYSAPEKEKESRTDPSDRAAGSRRALAWILRARTVGGGYSLEEYGIAFDEETVRMIKEEVVRLYWDIFESAT